ncbi:chemotaxis protein CheD [Oceanobacillus chungangensis]|uniref:Probable chemoreceptor glutamine deamidase CheD n=1 Tax=Oceanobacillus chungangensis TaxID=1229152 RepID=A0A3D8PPF0_9BACI|nr:chemotaxis protein CheD [Oceanobacillus chungangensis]RDW17814.1 chemotaxis protein CheD [Oceanobacillus chungangensis]
MKNSNQTVIRVGIADLKFVKAPDTIRTLGLGSCVGVVVYDDTKRIAGLAHVLLPDSSHTKQTNLNAFKYADTAIPILVDELVRNGASKLRLKAKIAGGAQMFQFTSNSDTMRIGARNVDMVKEMLKGFEIPIVSSDVGGNSGRTIEFDPITSELKIRKVRSDEYVI